MYKQCYKVLPCVDNMGLYFNNQCFKFAAQCLHITVHLMNVPIAYNNKVLE